MKAAKENLRERDPRIGSLPGKLWRRSWSEGIWSELAFAQYSSAEEFEKFPKPILPSKPTDTIFQRIRSNWAASTSVVQVLVVPTPDTWTLPVTSASTPALCSLNVESDSREGDLDARDLEMSKKVRRSYSRLETPGSASTSTPGRWSCSGFEGLLATEDLAGVSPVVGSKLTEVPRVPVKPWAPDTTLPGISPPAVKEKRKKRKVPEILKSELDEWAAAMNAEFEAAEQFDLLVE
nr:sororin-like [Delphinus delphis]